MAILKKKGILGAIGDVSVYERNGETVLRKRRNNSSKKKASAAQVAGRKGFKAAVEWVGPLVPMLRLGFRDYPGYTVAYNAARAYLQKNALMQEEEEWKIDPSLAKVSSGPLPMPGEMAASFQEGSGLTFTWNPAPEEKTSPRDRIMLLAYQPETGRAYFDTSGPQRMEGKAILKLSSEETGSFQLYAAFISEDGRTQSDSIYLGELTL